MASTVSPKNSPNVDSSPKPSVTPDLVSVSAKVILGEDEEEKWPQPVIADAKPDKPPARPSPETSDGTPVKDRTPRRQRRDPMVIERTNLLNVCKLVIKELIDSSLSRGRMLDDDNVPLQQFFVVLEHVLRHGIKSKKGILRDKREFWAVLEQVEKYMSDAVDITTSVREMPNIKTPLGRSRAWLRLALMQKRLADYFRILVDKKDELLTEFYEPGAIMLEEEAVVISGLLVGLNVIDCNLGIKDEDLDQPMGVIDFSLYLRDANHNSSQTPDEENQGSRIAAILDQKNYLEELNRHLNATVTNLQQKSEALQTANTLMKEDLAIAKNNILQLQQENSRLTNEKSALEEQIQKHVQTAKEDLDTERETYNTSRAGLEHLYQETKQRLEEETQMRLDVEKELELQISMKQEMEVALRLLEKDVHDKQDTVATLRKQMEEIKNINNELYAKLQDRESSLQHKTALVAKLEEKTSQMSDTIKELEQRLSQGQIDKLAFEETARKLGHQLAEKDAKRTALETDLKIEREWRGTLQKNLEQEKEKVTKLQNNIQQLQEVKKDYDALQEQHRLMKITCEEQERALAELGSHLSESKLRVEDMKEVQQALKEAQWADDREVTHCKQCEKAFSVSRRKHHCRNCGDIYCNECSDNKMPLPSSARPVRVCDSCQTLLLRRYSAN